MAVANERVSSSDGRFHIRFHKGADCLRIRLMVKSNMPAKCILFFLLENDSTSVD